MSTQHSDRFTKDGIRKGLKYPGANLNTLMAFKDQEVHCETEEDLNLFMQYARSQYGDLVVERPTEGQYKYVIKYPH